MDCACVLIPDEGDTPSDIDVSTKSSPLSCKCDECYREIKIGEEYEHVYGRWDGVWSTYRTCQDCLSVRNSFFCDGYCYTMIYENLQEHINDMGGSISEDCLSPLTPAARAKVCQIIESYWGDTDDD